MALTIIQFDYVVYHQNCSDGISSAWVTTLVNKNATLVSCFAGKDPDIPTENLYEKTVLFCDISPIPEYLTKLQEQNAKVVVIDHHNDAVAKIEHNTNIEIHTNKDNTKSGCILTWEYFFPDKPIPWFLEYISDRDTWNWKLPYSREINAALYEEKYITISGLDYLNLHEGDGIDKLKDELIREGRFIEETRKKLIEKFAKTAVLCKYQDSVGLTGRDVVSSTATGSIKCVWLYNCLPEYRSDVGNYLLKRTFKDKEGNEKTVDFTSCWHYNIPTNEFWISLRSEDSKADVCEIAKTIDNKGGGHRNAAGCTIYGDSGIKLRDIFIS